MSSLYQMEDPKSERIVYVGTEKQCLEFSKKEPEITYIMTEVKDGNKRSE